MRHRAVIIDELRGWVASLIGGGVDGPAIGPQRGICDVGGVVEGRVEAVDGGQRAAGEQQAKEDSEHFEDAFVDGAHSLDSTGEVDGCFYIDGLAALSL